MSAGVVSDGYLVAVVDGRRVGRRVGPEEAGGVWTFGHLYGAAVALGIADVFVCSWAWFDGNRAELVGGSVECTGDQGGAWRWRLSSPASFLCGPGAPGRVGGAVVHVVDVAADVRDVAGPFSGLEARELVDVLASLERLLGVPWASSTGRTAERLILSTHPRAKGGTLLDRAPVTPAPCEGSTLETAWSNWRRELTGDERRAGWLHIFDANAQYLAAWSTAELGHGVPVHHGGPRRFDARVCGVWRVPELGAVRPPFGELLPRPWLEGREWFTTATVARALEVCHGLDFPDVAESWEWPTRTRFLRGACERLRDARAAAVLERDRTGRAAWDELGPDDEARALELVRRHVVADVTLEAVKSVYRVQTGRFGMGARDASSPWARPDWGHIVRAQARVNLHRRLEKLAAAPFGIATDALLFLADEPAPAVFAERVRLPLGGGLGQFHHIATVPAGELGELAELGSALPSAIVGACRELERSAAA